ncbi:MAG TPA: hypothetical protein VFS67_16180 [Polyangiaceae bacterium]|nr:hypothetical protein [Polyangiaceae bacterium]
MSGSRGVIRRQARRPAVRRAELHLSALELGGSSDRAPRIAAHAVPFSGGVSMLVGLGAIHAGLGVAWQR